jgi:hypothetical protein
VTGSVGPDGSDALVSASGADADADIVGSALVPRVDLATASETFMNAEEILAEVAVGEAESAGGTSEDDALAADCACDMLAAYIADEDDADTDAAVSIVVESALRELMDYTSSAAATDT